MGKMILRICPSYLDEVETDIDFYFRHNKYYNSARRRNGVVEIASGINLKDAETEHFQEENIEQTLPTQSEVTILEHDPKIKELQDKILHLNRKHEKDREEIRKLRMDNDKNKLK